MKRIALLLLLVMFGALLSAVSFDDVLNQLNAHGKIEFYDGQVYWVSSGFSEDENQANAYVAWAAAIILYVKADWELSSNPTLVGQFKVVKQVSAYWYDEYDECSYLVSIPMSEVVSRFNTPSFQAMGFNELKDSIKAYVDSSGGVRLFGY